MIRCCGCGCDTPRLFVGQTRCPQCAREVAALITSDTRRRTFTRFLVARDTSRAVA